MGRRRILLYGAVACALAIAIAIHFRPWERAEEPWDVPSQPGILPFYDSPAEAVPHARMPGAAPLTLKLLAGGYSKSHQYGGRGIVFQPDGRWTYAVSGCMDGFVSKGTARIRDGRVILTLTEGAENAKQRTAACIPVFWGRRTYLLGAQELDELVDDINWGREPRAGDPFEMGGRTLVRADGEKNLPPAEGLPLLPEPYASRILKAPIEGKVVARRPDGTLDVNLGTAHGVFPGMCLGPLRTNKVLSVTHDACVIRSPEDEPVGARIQYPARGAARAR